MQPKKPFLTGVDIGLMVGIVVFFVSGVGYAGASGVVSVPGVKPFLKPAGPKLTSELPQALPSPSPSQVALADAALVSPVPSAPAEGSVTDGSGVPASSAASPDLTKSPAPAASPSPVQSPNSAASPSSSPSPSSASSAASSPAPAATLDPMAALKARDAERKAELGELQVALDQYYNKRQSLPVSDSFYLNRTNSPTTSLKVLVTEGLLKSLPLDPNDPSDWYGYKVLDNDNGIYQLTSRLEDANDPAGKREGTSYLYIVPHL